MQALALLAPGRCPRAEEERPESSNIHPGVAGPWAGSVPGTATWEPLAPSSSPPQPWADPCPLGRSSRRGSSPPDQGGNHGADSALGLQALQVQPAEGAGALLGSPPPTGARPSTGCVASPGHASPWAFPRAVALPSPTDAAPNALWALTHRAMPLPRVFDLSTPKQGSLGLSTCLPVMGLTYFSGGLGDTV